MQMSQHGTALTCDDILFDHNTQSTRMSTCLTPCEASIYLTPPPPPSLTSSLPHLFSLPLLSATQLPPEVPAAATERRAECSQYLRQRSGHLTCCC